MKLSYTFSIKNLKHIKKILLLLSVFTFCSCSSKNFSSLLKNFDESYNINMKDFSIKNIEKNSSHTISAQKTNEKVSAVFELSKLASYAKNADNWLSLLKRCIYIENVPVSERLEWFFNKAFTSCGHDARIRALYAHYLIGAGRYEDAIIVGESLSGSVEYASLLSEAQMRLAKSTTEYFKDSYSNLFENLRNIPSKYWTNSFTKLKNIFDVNAAIILINRGRLDNALKLISYNTTDEKTALFWAYLLKDHDSAEYQKLKTIIQVKGQSSPAALMISADEDLKLGDEKSAFEKWNKIVLMRSDISPYPYLNVSYYARKYKSLENDYKRAQALIEVTYLFPDYTPGLVDYRDMALEIDTEANRDLDALTKSVKNHGVRSIEMIKEDALLYLKLSDAVYYMQQALKRCNDDTLWMEYTKLQWMLEDHVTESEKLSDIWQLQEKYPKSSYIKRYATWFLANIKNYDDAYKLLEEYLSRTYNTARKDFTAITLLPWENEYMAYLNLVKSEKDADLSLKFYEKLNGEATKKNHGSKGFPLSRSNEVLMNAANIYASKDKTSYPSITNFNESPQMRCYRLAEDIAFDTKTKSEIQYKEAKLFYRQGFFEQALKLLDSALQYNPDNSSARQLRVSLLNNSKTVAY